MAGPRRILTGFPLRAPGWWLTVAYKCFVQRTRQANAPPGCAHLACGSSSVEIFATKGGVHPHEADNTVTSRTQSLFYEVFEHLPRQGPGSLACTQRALDLCGELPARPRVVDLGCGGGAQTLDLAQLTDGSILAIDSHAPLIQRLRAKLEEQGLADRVEARVGDMSRLSLAPESFDLVWSEGALYNIGLEQALPLCRQLLRSGGYLAFTDAVWCTPDPPAQVRAAFADYPTMGSVDEVLALVQRGGWALIGHFALPPAAWWDRFYTPMEQRLAQLRRKYVADVEALAVLDEIAEEPAMHRRWGDTYGYEFFVLRKP